MIRSHILLPSELRGQCGADGIRTRDDSCSTDRCNRPDYATALLLPLVAPPPAAAWCHSLSKSGSWTLLRYPYKRKKATSWSPFSELALSLPSGRTQSSAIITDHVHEKLYPFAHGFHLLSVKYSILLKSSTIFYKKVGRVYYVNLLRERSTINSSKRNAVFVYYKHGN